MMFKKKDYLEAVEISLSSNKDVVLRNFNLDKIHELLLGKELSVGDIAYETKEEGSDSTLYPDFISELFSTRLIVRKTIPEGLVTVTEKTKIIFLEDSYTIEDINEKLLINVKKEPNLRDLTLVSDIEDIVKLSKAGLLVNRFVDKNETIYFTENYYFKHKI
jgi:hypothetical protein